MADNELYIDTRLRTDSLESDIAKVEEELSSGASGMSKQFAGIDREIDKVVKKIDALIDKEEKFIALGGNTKSKQFQGMEYDIEKLREKLIELTSRRAQMGEVSTELERTSESVKKIGDASKRASRSVSSLGNSAKKSAFNFKKLSSFFLKYVIGVRSFYYLARKLRTALVDGFKNLAQFNNGMNPVNESLSRLKSSLTQTKNTFASAFAPILTAVEPVLLRLINLINKAVTAMGMLFSALSGNKTFTKAISVQENFAKSLDSTGASAKKAKNQLASFDELNVLNKDDSSSGGGGSATNPNDMFEVVEIDSKIMNMADKMKGIFDGISFDSLENSFQNLRDKAQPVLDDIRQSADFLIENGLKPLATWTIEEGLPVALDTVSSALDTLHTAFETLNPSAQKFYEDIIKPFAEFCKDEFIVTMEYLQEDFSELSDLISTKGDSINTILGAIIDIVSLLGTLWMKVWTKVRTKFHSVVLFVIELCGTWIDIIAGVIDFVKDVFAGDWDKAWEDAKNVVKIALNGIASIIEKIVNAVINKVNEAFTFDVPEWFPIAGGEHFELLNVKNISIPRLASGTVVPRQAKEFTAILGDNNKETEVVSPLSTMKQAMLEALAEAGGVGGGDVYISADGDMDALIRLLNLKITRENARVGRNFVKVV